jgi:glycerol-3-phosphate acyltransferase PlsX
MGEAYAKDLLGVENPRVGLLSNGEEDSKGNELTKESFKLLKSMPSFVGNVEGSDIFNGSVDVITCDGFVGNILLKTSEGVASSITKLIKLNIKRSPRALTGALLMRKVFKLLKK